MDSARPRSQRALETYLSCYRDKCAGQRDLLWAFRLTGEHFGCRRALYPGSYLHVTPSLVFPEVRYVDSVKNIGSALGSPQLLEYVNKHKEYAEDASIRCYEEDYVNFASEPLASFFARRGKRKPICSG